MRAEIHEGILSVTQRKWDVVGSHQRLECLA